MTARTRWSAADLMSATFPEPNWAVPGIVAEGLNLLVGAPKVGKSWLSLGLAVSASAGGTALGRLPVKAGGVLYLALEDTPRRLQRRLQMVLNGDGPPDRLTFVTESLRAQQGGLDQLDKLLAISTDVRLVIIDVLAKFRSRPDARSSAYDADFEALSGIKTIADRHGVPVLVVHHTRKADSEDFLDSVSGTHGIAGAADTVLVLKRARSKADGVLHVTGRDVEETSYALGFNGTRGLWTLMDGKAADYEMHDTRRKILGSAAGRWPDAPKTDRRCPRYRARHRETDRATHGRRRPTRHRRRRALHGPPCTPVTPVTPVTRPR